MVRGGCLPVSWSETIKWKYQDDLYGCRQVETEEHINYLNAIDMDTSENDGEEQ